jgi:hypothetical protein
MINMPWLSGEVSRTDGPNGGSLAAANTYGNLSNILAAFNAGDIVDSMAFELNAFGRFTTSTAGATAFALRVAGSSVTIFQTANFTPANTQTNSTWRLNIVGKFQLSAANVAGFIGCSQLLINGTTNPILSPTTAPAIGSTFDPTVSQNLFLGMISAAATAGQSFQCHYAALKWLQG